MIAGRLYRPSLEQIAVCRSQGYVNLADFTYDILDVFRIHRFNGSINVNTLRQRIQQCLCFIRLLHAQGLDLRPEHLDPRHYASFDSHLKGERLSAASIRSYRMALRKLFEELEDRGRKLFNWRSCIRTGRRKQSWRTFITFEQLRLLVATLASSRDPKDVHHGILIAFLAATGLRTTAASGASSAAISACACFGATMPPIFLTKIARPK